MTANEYQKLALRTMNKKLSPKANMCNAVMGLCGEAGEVSDLIKKALFQDHELDKEHAAKELGDIAWYLSLAAWCLGYTLDEIFEMNIAKLESRYPGAEFDAEKSINRKEGDI